MSTTALRDHFLAQRGVNEDSVAALEEPSARVTAALIDCLRGGGKIVCFGNGGSATQASHMAGELLGRFRENRRPLPAISLGSDPGTVTCIANDFGYDTLFERQVEALVSPGDAVIGLTTSGRSENVLRALEAAKKRGAITVALCGSGGLKRAGADHILAVPSDVTAHVQEVHLMLLHVWCIGIDAAIAEGAL